MTVLYAEVPGFYAEVERVEHPSLEGRPVLVGGDPRKNGTVQSATGEARGEGVTLGMPLIEALDRCPRAKVFRTDMPRYRDASARLRATLRRFIDRLEPAGLGAAYLDASGVARPAEEVAGDLVKSVREDLGLPLRLGISNAKFLARLVAEQGPEEIARVVAGREQAFLAGLPLERLPGVGPTTAARLAGLGATTIGEVAGLERGRVEAELGVHGHTIWELAHGRDPARVQPAHRKSLSQESSFAPEELDSSAILERLRMLGDGLATSLAREELRARRVTLKLRYVDGERVSRSCTVDAPLGSGAEIYDRAASLLGRTQAGSRPVRGAGIVLGGLAPVSKQDRQLDLFGRPR
ncbi:MAG: DNA polymerase IV [Deltaproteobacteria bacterium]|nr:DNA polymerase IV [Deltaproteobacteria bacterium]MBW2446023.1 DNA polymerase IV [Deltaproteobacteria bacterium]